MNSFYFSRSYLRDVVEIAHIFYKIMEKFCNGRVVVQHKRNPRQAGPSKNKRNRKEPLAEEEKVSENEDFFLNKSCH